MYSQKNCVIIAIYLIIITALAFGMVGMFDTLGTPYYACKRVNLLDEGSLWVIELLFVAMLLLTH